MDAGQLDQRITLRKRATTTNELNEVVESFFDLATVWARVLPLSRRDQFVADQTANLSTTRFNIRYRRDFDTRDRIVHEGKEYQVEDVTEIGIHDGLSILGTARGP